MKNWLLKFAMLLIIVPFFTSCDDDNDSDSHLLSLSITGLEDLGNDYAYEGWIIVNGGPVSTGTFTVNNAGQLSQSTFDLDKTDLENASTFVLTIEPSPDADPNPSDVHIIAGDFNGSSANLDVDHGAALGDDFSTASGEYILATPTDGPMTNEFSGVWWLDPSGPAAALDLPTLPAGWIYEGWAVINGTPVTTGKFLDVAGADDSAQYSGMNAGPPFPGEDFLQNAPGGLSFPTDLRSGAVVISIEPVPDNSESPFLLKPLVGNVPADALDHTIYGMSNNANATNPVGLATRVIE